MTNLAAFAVLAMILFVIVSAAAIAISPARFFYELAGLTWADLWPKLKAMWPKILAFLTAASEETRKRNVADSRRRVERDARGRERLR